MSGEWWGCTDVTGLDNKTEILLPIFRQRKIRLTLSEPIIFLYSVHRFLLSVMIYVMAGIQYGI